ncbi:lysophospholipase L1-like esterase [Mucilaginibacter sp. UYP25]|uniref:SGNH/GDSL hydrolase family protein n=1 Tax=unclassified Mucilaginibacter TaxID=2617802 RepID=UPI0033964F3F
MRVITTLFLIGTFAACTKATMPTQAAAQKPNNNMPATDTLTYLALGDSYTIGEAVPLDKSFPYQLAANLKASNHVVTNADIIAVTGWTTGDLKQGITQRGITKHDYNIVTLLIGVNNQFRGYGREDYRKEFIELLTGAINYAGGNKKHVFVLSIPDWSVTPFAKNGGYDAEKVGAEIDQFNAINKQETEKLGVTYVDITPASRRASYETTLIANDGLHPSSSMYSLWVAQLLPVVNAQLAAK